MTTETKDDDDDDDRDPDVRRANQLIASCGLLLAGENPGVQGAVIADLLGTFLAGHYAERPEDDCEVRAEILAHLLQTAAALTTIRAGRRRPVRPKPKERGVKC